MRLSEAIMLGSSTCKMESCNINSCAYGAAMNAMGVPEDATMLPDGVMLFRYAELKRIWPWTAENGQDSGLSALACSVYEKFDYNVCGGRMTLEQLADYVRSIEPDCGDCNRFTCTCDKAASPESITEGVCVPS